MKTSRPRRMRVMSGEPRPARRMVMTRMESATTKTTLLTMWKERCGPKRMVRTARAEEVDGAEEEKGGDGDEVVDGVEQARIGERVDAQGEGELIEHPEADAVEDGEEGEPEEEGVEASAEEGVEAGEQTDGGDGGAQKEEELVVVEEAQDFTAREEWIGRRHGRLW